MDFETKWKVSEKTWGDVPVDDLHNRVEELEYKVKYLEMLIEEMRNVQ